MIKPDMAWPPKALAKVIERTQESQVWWEGDVTKLDTFYRNNSGRRSFIEAGVVGKVTEFLYGKPESASKPSRKLHAPIPADIAKLSAQELGSEPLTVIDPTGSKGLQERADLIFNTPTFHGDLFTAFESTSALGGNYQRVVWDDTVADNAWIDFVDVDKAIPEFVWGRLRAVTFWSELAGSDDRDVWRHLQRYEKGRIVHSLYKGTPTNLGAVNPLTEHPDTAGIVLDGFDEDTGGYVDLGVNELAARYVPNVLPNPEWRNDSTLRHLGLADIRHDLFPIFQGLDLIYSSLPREFRIGQARMFASEQLLTNHGPGRGASFSEDQEIFTEVRQGVKDGDATSMFEFHQPAIRVLEHDQGAEMLLRRVLSTTGYSPNSFGMSDEVAQTATEARGKKEATVNTTKGKARYWGASLGPLSTICMQVDAAKFKGVAPTEELVIDWPQFARESDEAKSRTVLNWSTSNSASTYTKVAYQHEDWDDERVQEEVDKIREEAGAPVPEPDFGGGDRPPIPPEPPVDETDTDPEE